MSGDPVAGGPSADAQEPAVRPPAVFGWHRLVATGDLALLDDLLADDVVFRSPAVHSPQVGRDLTTRYLTAAVAVLGPTLRYVREWYGPGSAVLEFTAVVDGLDVHGVDLLTWDGEDRLTEFAVMVRPLRGLDALVRAMRAELEGPGA